MIKPRYFLLAFPVVVAAGWLALGHSTQTASAAPDRARPPSLVAPGHVEPVRDAAKLAFESQGRIAGIEVEEGAVVTAGQVLAHLDDRMAKARVAEAEAAVAQAKARHLLAARGPRREDVDAARADAEAAAASAAHRGIEQARSAHLGEVGAVATTLVDADDAAARVATAQASAATARYQSLAKGTRVEQIDEAAAALLAAQAELEAARVALDQTLLRAPADGIVLRRTAEVGDLVTLTNPQVIMTVADLSKLEIRAEIDEAEVAQVAPGQLLYATAEAFGDRRFPLHVTRITHELGRRNVRDDDPRAHVDTRVLEVIATFDGASPALPLGLRMSVVFGR